MTPNIQHTAGYGIGLLPMLPIFGLLVALYWLTMGRERRSWVAALVTALAVVGLTVGRAVEYEDTYHGDVDEVIFESIFLFVGLGGMVMAGWSSWGRTGWKAWLQWRAVIWTGVMTAGMPALNEKTLMVFLGGLLPFALAAICLEPEKKTAAPGGMAPADGPKTARGDRERVLGLLERGAIAGDEAAELLAAIGENRTEAGATPRGLQLRWCGLALVVLGFFLPWAKINVGEAMSEAMGSLMQQVSVNAPMPNLPNGMELPEVVVHAADLKYGMGWMILGLAVAVVALPQFRGFRRQPADTRRTTLAWMAGIGLVLSLYMAAQLLQYAQLGLLLNLAGYGLLVVVLWRESRGSGAGAGA